MISFGELINEGKTKKIWQHSDDASYVLVESKDDITAGDGAKHDVMAGKAALSTQTTCSVFEILKKAGLPVAYVRRESETVFVSKSCQMIPLEVVVRREAHGSYLKRNPDTKKGDYFARLAFELFLKTTGKKWNGVDIPKDDPLIIIENTFAELYLPDNPIEDQEPFLVLEDDFPLKLEPFLVDQIEEIARRAFLVLEKCWKMAGYILCDFKIEFGITKSGDLVISDVIDNDSWRVRLPGDPRDRYLDKQNYRDGAEIDQVLYLYKLVCSITDQFVQPKQQIVLWRASKGDDTSIFHAAIENLGLKDVVDVTEVTLSAHKSPLECVEKLKLITLHSSNCVIVTHVGRSNGLGPMLASNTHLPVITVPAGWREFPDDVWSSLRAPSNCPVATVLDPSNAIQLARNILLCSQSTNPWAYAYLQYEREKMR